MPSIDEEIEQMYRENPILEDQDFLEKYPGVQNVAGFVNSQLRFLSQTDEKDKWVKMGVEKIGDFLKLLEYGHGEAVETYVIIRDTLRFR